MMRKQYTAAFKAKVVQELLKEEKTLAQIATDYEVHPTQLKEWRVRTIEGLLGLFEKHDGTAELRAAHEEYGGPLCQDTKIGFDKSYFPPSNSCVLNVVCSDLVKIHFGWPLLFFVLQMQSALVCCVAFFLSFLFEKLTLILLISLLAEK